MASTSAQTVEVPEPKPVETTSAPRPVSQPVNKPFTIKILSQIPF